MIFFMHKKQLLFTGAATVAVAKYYSGASWKSALVLGAVAMVAAAVADNVLPE
jgi:hypothetical protein